VQSTPQELTTILIDSASLTRWWPSVYLDVQQVSPGDQNGLGAVTSLYTKGWLPYTLRWQFRITETRHPFGFTLKAWGDFVGRGIWTFEPEAAPDGDGRHWVRVIYDWQISAEKPLLKYYSFIMKPIFSANHHWAMARGEESLNLELARRRASSPDELAAIPQPPGPTFAFLLPKGGKALNRLLV
jgi:hypothetical protein